MIGDKVPDRNAMEDRRMTRGYTFLRSGARPRQVDRHTFIVPSQSDSGEYTVIVDGDEWHCECPDHRKRRIACKHIHAVRLWTLMNDGLNRNADDANATIACETCGSDSWIRYGKRNGKQVYKCKDCSSKFTPSEWGKTKYDPRVISITLDLYFKGVSLRKIADHLRQFYELTVDHSAVRRWIKFYSKVLDEYVSQFEPQLSNSWDTDEMKVKVRGKWHWLWNVVDEGTRYKLVAVISKHRDEDDARRAFRKAKAVAHGLKPKEVHTDGMGAYHNAFNKEFYDHHQSVRHVQVASIRDRKNNNIVERVNGTVREREKVMRGLKVTDTPIIDTERIYYNFVRPHMALHGGTPAEAAGIFLGLGENRWMELIKQGIAHRKAMADSP